MSDERKPASLSEMFAMVEGVIEVDAAAEDDARGALTPRSRHEEALEALRQHQAGDPLHADADEAC